MKDVYQEIPPLDPASRDFISSIGEVLRPNEYVAEHLAHVYPSCARRVRDCGRFAVKRRPIELRQSASGHYFMSGVNRCHSRYCRWCHSNLMGVLAARWAARAREAEHSGFGCAMVRLSVEACEPGELNAAVTLLLAILRESFPASSRLPRGWASNELGSFIGMDWNVEIDWDADQAIWLPHIHANAYKRDGAWTESQLGFFRGQWLGRVAPYAAVAESAEATARYAVKASNKKVHLLNFFDLIERKADRLAEEYLDATITHAKKPRSRTLRSTSRKLSKLISASTALTDEQLAKSVEAQQGRLVVPLTGAQWRQATRASG